MVLTKVKGLRRTRLSAFARTSAVRSHPELNLGDADEEAAWREGDQPNPARPNVWP
jgi:hypothetical protein